MKNYQYQILRYYPDVVAEEFINVGIVFFIPEERKLISKVIESSSRLNALYHGVDSKSVVHLLKNVNGWLNTKGKELLEQLNHNDYSKIDAITYSILPPNDSSLRFSDVRSGITVNSDQTFEDMFIRFVSKYERKTESHSKDDTKAWNEYKKVFEKHSIDKRLRKPDVKIKTTFNNEFEFSHGWKNGKWNFFKPISFDLATADNIRKKVWEQVGFTQELLTSDSEFSLTYLALSPKIANSQSINAMLNSNFTKDTNGKTISIVFEDKAEEYAAQLSLQLDHSPEHI
ncbi:MAG: DUF3037 domain-containing protein [Melioribacteraceae bacterium]